MVFINKEDMRRRPYLPNFRRTPARIIDPATGASTWALGNQRWKIYRGILTIKAVIVIIHHIFIRKDEDRTDKFIDENIKRWELCL